MARLAEHYHSIFPNAALSLEARELISAAAGNTVGYPIYVLLTDTKTRFSKISRLVTKDPFNHVSLTFDEEFSEIYTYALANINGLRGGLKKETRDVLRGASYSLYKIEVTQKAYSAIRRKIKELEKSVGETRYNHLGLINAIFQKEIFDSEDGMRMICSQFVAEIFKAADIHLFKDRAFSSIRPYEFVKSKLLKFVRRGVIR